MWIDLMWSMLLVLLAVLLMGFALFGVELIDYIFGRAENKKPYSEKIKDWYQGR